MDCIERPERFWEEYKIDFAPKPEFIAFKNRKSICLTHVAGNNCRVNCQSMMANPNTNRRLCES